MTADREQFLPLIARLRAVAKKHGDGVFAGALDACLVDASGGAPSCPMAGLILEEYVQTGHLPKIDGKRTTPLRPMNVTDPPPYDRQRLLNYVHHVLEARAALKSDTHYVKALQACQKAMQESDGCPMHRILKEQT
jgi:hypothetical protein